MTNFNPATVGEVPQDSARYEAEAAGRKAAASAHNDGWEDDGGSVLQEEEAVGGLVES